MNAARRADEDQLTLWEHCHLCNGIHYGLGPDMWGRRREHRPCHVALDRWYRTDNQERWVAEPNRAAQ